MVGPQLHHREALLLQTTEGEGQADVVVEVAAGGQSVAYPRQDGGQHLLHRGLAVAAGDRHHPGTGGLAPERTEPPQPRSGVLHPQAGQGPAGAAVHQGAGGAGFGRLFQEVVAVETGTVQRHEEVAGPEAAAVAAHPAHLGVGAVQYRRQLPGQLAESEADHASSSSQRRTCSRSLNGCFRSPTCW